MKVHFFSYKFAHLIVDGMMRRILLICFLIVFNEVGLLLASIKNNGCIKDYKQKLAQLFVVHTENVDADYIYLPGYIIGDKISLSKYNNRDVKQIIDCRTGKDDELAVPFPDTNVLLNITSKSLVDSLKRLALMWECKKGADGIFTIQKNNRQLISVLTDSSLEAKYYPVVDFPVDILKMLPYRDFEKIQIKPGSFSVLDNNMGELNFLNWNGELSLHLSFEELLDKDFLFYSENFKRDYEKLIRAYEQKLMLIDSKVQDNYAVDTTGIKRALGRLGKKLELKQTSLRQRAFRKSIALYQKKNVIPVIDIENTVCVVDDYRKQANGDFISRASYYHPGVREYNPQIDDVDLYISLCDASVNLISLSEGLRKRDFKSSTKKVLVAKGLPASFYNSTLLNVFDAVIVADVHPFITWDMLAQAVFGGFAFNGADKNARRLLETGFKQSSVEKIRLGFSHPECEGMNTDTLELVDRMMSEAIRQKATPGAQILVARNGQVVWQKAYGYHTYSEKTKVDNGHLYDVASVTKLCATLPVMMSLYEKKQINLDDSLINYLPGIDTTDKKDITIKQLLLHQSGLPGFIPFHTNAIDQGSLNGHSLYNGRYSSVFNIKLDNWYYQNRYARFRDDIFQNHPDSLFKIRVSDKCYMNYHYVDSMKTMAYNSKLRDEKDYWYSDVGYHFLHLVMNQQLKVPLEQYYYSCFTKPLGMGKVVYKPLDVFNKGMIVPTENDLAFRRELLHGYVHDPGAAMIGGVAANAGIFANSGDLAKMSQMLLNKGNYGGRRYLNVETIECFTTKKDSLNRRGLGIDKPETDPEKQSPASSLASPSSYGHTGFTGTMVWIDPEYQLIYIFLSNRVYPRAYNKKLIESNVRTNIQDVIYKSIIIR